MGFWYKNSDAVSTESMDAIYYLPGMVSAVDSGRGIH